MTPAERACFWLGAALVVVGDLAIRALAAFLRDMPGVLSVLPR